MKGLGNIVLVYFYVLSERKFFLFLNIRRRKQFIVKFIVSGGVK